MSLFAELKRRKVIKVGAAYLVVAWLVIQVAATVSPQLGLPEWAPRLITLILLLGLPVTIVITWAFEVTPEGIKRDAAQLGNKRVYVGAAVIAALALGWFLGAGLPMGGKKDAVATAELGERSTAVLPFVNMSADKDNEYFSDGLTETLLHKLAQLPELKVAARTSSFAFKGKNTDIREIGTQLGVATVVEGSVQRAGDTLRITAQLVRTADGSHIWSRSYDRKLADLFAIQDEIAGAVTEALVGALLPKVKAAMAQGDTRDVAAYDAYARGLQEAAKNTYGALQAAERSIQQALALDPEYVDALLGLVSVWRDMTDTGLIDKAEFISRSVPVMQRIEQLAPGNAVALGFRAVHVALGGDAPAALSLMERAVAQAPGNAELHAQHSLVARDARRYDLALAAIDAALALDPLNGGFHRIRSSFLKQLERYDEAEQAALRSLQLNPGDSNPMADLGEIAGRRGDLAGHVFWFRKAANADPSDHEFAAVLAILLQDIGEPVAANAWLAESRRLRPGNLFAEAAMVEIANARGELEPALAAALGVVGRHAEERRGNWGRAIVTGCHAATKLGRIGELREALERERFFPRELTPEGFRALVSPTFSLDHQLAHLQLHWACRRTSDGDMSAVRAQLEATVRELDVKGWEQDRFRQITVALLHGDREKLIAALLPPAYGELAPALYEARVRTLGIADDPRIVARAAEIRAAIPAQKAKLAERLAADGIPMTPR